MNADVDWNCVLPCVICCRYLYDGIAQHFAAAAVGYACQGDNCVCVFWLFIIRTPLKWIFDCLAYFIAKSARAKKCRSRERTTLPVIFFLFYFFHFSKMRSWGLSGREHGGDERVTWPTLPVDGIPHRHPETCFFFLSVFLTYSFLASLSSL